ncbi:hypothetical protein AMEX_G19482, partial [Astyanax mexicanus]
LHILYSILFSTVGAVIRSTIQDSEIKPVVPATVEVCSGSYATINCTFTTDSEGLTIRWHFNSLSSQPKTEDNDEHYEIKNGKTWSALTIKEVTFNDSGLYYCVVIQDIPILKEYSSNGSKLNVIVGAVIRSTIQDSEIKPVVPATVEVCSGSYATINCTFTTDSEGLKIRWHFNSFSSQPKTEDNDKHYEIKNGKTWSALTIKEVTFNDSGLYYCVVIQDIPILKDYSSNGSKLNDSEIKPVVPATVEVCSGSNATINCTFTTDSEGLKIRWHFNSSSSESKIDHNDEHYDLKNEKTWSALTIKEVTFNDSGLYYCEVIQDIPILKEYYSNGTQLNVIGK